MNNLPRWKATLKNNTDYQHGKDFYSVEDLKSFVKKYYSGKPGDKYAEHWMVSGDYPEEILDILEPGKRK